MPAACLPDCSFADKRRAENATTASLSRVNGERASRAKHTSE